tara:strand:- start:1683 stop:2327 length:645 start_codon:yes stop_codon:yes gene_type:complete
MDEDLSIIDSKTRNEKIKNFFINNRNKIIIFLIIVLLTIMSFFGFNEYMNAKKKKISDQYNSILVDYSNGKNEGAKEKLVNLVNKKDSTYSPLSLYFIIDNEIIKETNEINNLFNILINKTNLEYEIKNLIIYKKALFNADIYEENELLENLKPLINKESVWKSHALYLIAEYYYSKNEKQKSKEFFNKILSIENANKDIINETQKRLNRDFSD